MKIWTLEEMDAIRARYPSEPTAVLAAELGVPVKQLGAKACALGVKKLGCERYRNARHHRWTEAEDAEIKRWWPVIAGRRDPGKTAEWLAKRLGVKASVVQTRAGALGLRKVRQKEPDWSEEEIDLLDLCLHLTCGQIRRRFLQAGYSRTEGAIAVARNRLVGGVQNAMGGMSANQFADWMGYPAFTVAGWIKKGWLRATMRGDSLNPQGGPGDRWIITPRDARAFVVANAALINPSGINFVWLIDLLANEAAEGYARKTKRAERKEETEEEEVA